MGLSNESSMVDMLISLVAIFILLFVCMIAKEQEGRGSPVYLQELITKINKKIELVQWGDLEKPKIETDPTDPLAIKITETDKNNNFFASGSEIPSEKFQNFLIIFSEKILFPILSNLKDREIIRQIIIEGHTDSLPFAGSEYGNLRLSQGRSREVMERLLLLSKKQTFESFLFDLTSAAGRAERECKFSYLDGDENLSTCRKVIFKLRVKSIAELEHEL